MSKEAIDHLNNKFNSIKDMCDYWGIDITNYYSRYCKMGWSLEKSLVTPINNYKHLYCIKDHLGNKFNTIKEMCNYWGISQNLYTDRVSRGWSLEKSLTYPIKNKIQVIDHLGNSFNSIKEMCDCWGLKYYLYFQRKHLNWSLERILTDKGNICKDHLGNQFNSKVDMCKYWNIDYNIFSGRIRCGMSLEKALTKGLNICKDHLGNVYKYDYDMCDYWGINYNTYKTRIRNGMSKELALTLPVINKSAHKHKYKDFQLPKPIKDHLNKEFDTVFDMCNYWKIRECIFVHRMKRGYTLEESLTLPLRKRKI